MIVGTRWQTHAERDTHTHIGSQAEREREREKQGWEEVERQSSRDLDGVTSLIDSVNLRVWYGASVGVIR